MGGTFTCIGSIGFFVFGLIVVFKLRKKRREKRGRNHQGNPEGERPAGVQPWAGNPLVMHDIELGAIENS